MASANTTLCSDTSDALELCENYGLYLKPMARLNVCVQLPQLKISGKSISNWEVMEKVKGMIRPDVFITIKIIKSTLDFIRLEAEAENKSILKTLIMRLDSKIIKLSGFPDSLKVRAAEAKINFPSRHDWDSYFRDAKNMNEMKPGERPDTVHFKDLPTRWFASSRERDKPSEQILKKVYEPYGEIRCVDIPMLDPYRKEMVSSQKTTAIQTFTFGQDLTFDAFVQYKDYISFVKAMIALKGMKLMYREKEADGKAFTANIKVDFDKTKHLSDKAIRKRRLEREKLEALEQQREEKVRREREDDERKKEEERKRKEEEERDRERKRLEKIQRREERIKAREQKRRERKMEKKRKDLEKKHLLKIALEERKLLLDQRKLESLRILTELFVRVKVIKMQEDLELQEKEVEMEKLRQVESEKRKRLEHERKKLLAQRRKKEKLEQQEVELRTKILKNLKTIEEKKEEQTRESLRKKIQGKTRLKSAIIMKR